MRPKYFAAVLGVAAGLALLPGAAAHVARADTTGTPTQVGSFNCLANASHATVPAGSTIIIRQIIGEQTLGILNDFLNAETAIVSVNDNLMFDASNQFSAPSQQPDGRWRTTLLVPSGVTLAQAGDQMRFTFALVIAGKVPEVFNPAAGGDPGQPIPNGPGLSFGGTCTVTAT